MTITLLFKGSRNKPFTTKVGETAYYVEPRAVLSLPDADAKALLERDAHLWERVDTVEENTPQSERKRK